MSEIIDIGLKVVTAPEISTQVEETVRRFIP
jgi:hypothetical protein